MPSKTLHGGVEYEIAKGRALHAAVGYDIEVGRTLLGGTGYDVLAGPGEVPAGMLDVGASVYTNVNGVRTEFIVVHQGIPDTSIYDASCDGTWLLMKDLYGTHAYMDALNVNFSDSNMRSYLNDEFIYLLDDATVSGIVTAVIPYSIAKSYSSATVKTGSSGVSAKIFLLSGVELNIGTSGVPAKEGAVLSYFSSCNKYGTDSKRVAYLDGVASTWWTRSVWEKEASRATTYVTTSGSADSSSGSNARGVRPAFILGSDTLIRADTFDILG